MNYHARIIGVIALLAFAAATPVKADSSAAATSKLSLDAGLGAVLLRRGRLEQHHAKTVEVGSSYWFSDVFSLRVGHQAFSTISYVAMRPPIPAIYVPGMRPFDIDYRETIRMSIVSLSPRATWRIAGPTALTASADFSYVRDRWHLHAEYEDRVYIRPIDSGTNTGKSLGGSAMFSIALTDRVSLDANYRCLRIPRRWGRVAQSFIVGITMR